MNHRASKTVHPGITRLLFAIVFALLALPLQAADTLNIPVASGDDIPIERHQAEGDTAIIWMPSDFGVQPPQTVVAQ